MISILNLYADCTNVFIYYKKKRMSITKRILYVRILLVYEMRFFSQIYSFCRCWAFLKSLYAYYYSSYVSIENCWWSKTSFSRFDKLVAFNLARGVACCCDHKWHKRRWYMGQRCQKPLRASLCKHETCGQCWCNVGPASQTVAQHYTSIGSTSPACWATVAESVAL